MKRYKHSLSHYNLTTLNMGKLYPVGCLEVLPGDAFRHNTSALIRTPALARPLMHPIGVRIHHFYVPNRLVWSGWEDFITGESATPPPTIQAHGGDTYNEAPLFMGYAPSPNHEMSCLPIRAFNMIYNQYYKDQDLITDRTEDDITIPNIAWEKDYFSASRPWAQKGDAVTIPIGTEAPVKGIGFGQSQTPSDGSITVDESDGTSPTYTTAAKFSDATSDLNRNWYGDFDGGDPNIYADLSQADQIDVRDFREAFALQRYQEARARYGSNYVDYLRYCGLRPSDARLQRAEYLGGGKQTLTFSEVIRTSGTQGTTLGELAGHGIGALRSNTYQRFFEEHGHVITMMSIRPKTVYNQMAPRKFNRTTKEDYFQKELQDIGQQEVLNKEVYTLHATPEATFGYANRYHEYTDEQSYISGEMADEANSANEWHLARQWAAGDPTLNQSFVECDPRNDSWTSTTEGELQVMVQHSVKARRPVRTSNVGRII